MQDASNALAPMDFSTFVMSLASSAMIHLCQMPSATAKADAPATKHDLPAAKQIIDILGMLEEKTSGNLDDTERRLMKNLLADLRLKFVKCSEAASGTDGSDDTGA